MAGQRNLALSIVTRLVVALGVLVVAAVVFSALARTRPQPARTAEAERRPRVIVMPARPVAVRRTWEGFGTAHAMNAADVPARVTATVAAVPPAIVAGAAVEEGTLLVQLDDHDFVRHVESLTQRLADLDAQLARLAIEADRWAERGLLAEEQVALARAELARVQEAERRGGAKVREVDLARQALLASQRDETVVREEIEKIPSRRASLVALRAGTEAEKRIAMLNVARCRIVSPLPGVLQSVHVERGENVAAGDAVARVVDPALIEVPLRLPSSARATVRVGDEVALRSTGAVERAFTAAVTRITPEDDDRTRTMAVYVELEQDRRAAGGLAPGTFLQGWVRTRANEERWIVPRRALDGDRVLFIRDGIIVSRPVEVAFQVEGRYPELGLPDVQWAVLASPLNPNDLVVVTPSRALPDGLAVHPVDASDATVRRDGPGGRKPDAEIPQ